MNPLAQPSSALIPQAARATGARRFKLRWPRGFNIGLLIICFVAFKGKTATAAPPPATHPYSDSAERLVPASVDLRPEFDRLNLPRWRQGNRPTCSAFTVTGALEFATAKRQGQGTRLSVEFLNWASNRCVGSADDGGFFSDLWKGFATNGICTAEALPYADSFDPAASPSTEALTEAKSRLGLGLQFHWIKEWDVNTGLTDAHVSGIKETLAAGWPVCAGLRWPKQEQWIDDVLQFCPPEAVRDGHSILLVGYRDDAAQPGGGVLTFRNTANDGRDGFMTYKYARAYMNDAAWIDYAPQSKPHQVQEANARSLDAKDAR